MPAPNPQRQREARARLAGLFAHRASVYVVHYACEGFDDNAQRASPRVTAVSARHLETGEVTTFSFHAEIERAGLTPMQALARYDEIERRLLDGLFAFLQANRAMRFVHWNMRDAFFGFAAIEHRYQVLGGTPVVLPEQHKYDLARLVVEIYGSGKGASRTMEALARANKLVMGGVMSGAQEAEAFEHGGYAAIQRSTIGKVRLIFDILHLVHDRTLKTDAGWWTMNVGRVREAVEMFDRNPVHAVAGLVVAVGSVVFGVVLKWLG